LTDEHGNVILSFRDMGLANDNMVDGALAEILGFAFSDSDAVSMAQQLMRESSMLHSYSNNPDEWFWTGEGIVEFRRNGVPIYETADLTSLNMGKEISLSSISSLYENYNSISDSSNAAEFFINNVYGSAIDLLLHSESMAAYEILSNVYSSDEIVMIYSNLVYYTYGLNYGIDINSMLEGNVRRTNSFDNDTGLLKLSSSTVPGAKILEEIHPGIDLVGSGRNVNVPGGYWEFISSSDPRDPNAHGIVLSLFGGSLRMRILHLDPADISMLEPGTIFGGQNQYIINYPTRLFGNGTGTHIHVEMTRNLPYNNAYTRQYVNPDTLLQGNQLNYFIRHYDINMNILRNIPFNRNF